MTPLSLKSVVTSYIVSLAVCIPVERLDGRPLRHAARVFRRRRRLHDFVGPVRPRDQRADAGRSADPAGDRRGDDDAGRPAHHRAHVREVGAADGDEFRHHPGAHRPDAGTDHRRAHRALAVVAGDLLRQRAGRDRRRSFSSAATCRITATRSRVRSISIGLVLFGAGAALLSWLLEVFGEHDIDPTSAAILLGFRCACWPRSAGMRARARIRCCGSRCSGCARFACR